MFFRFSFMKNYFTHLKDEYRYRFFSKNQMFSKTKNECINLSMKLDNISI